MAHPAHEGAPTTRAMSADEGSCVVLLEDLRFAYPGASHPAVDGVSLRVGRGEIVGLLGPSGAGKTTTQRLLLGLLPGAQGRVEVLGRPVQEWGPALFDRVGVGFELPTSHRRLTARENLELFAALLARPRDPVAVLSRLGLGDVADQRVETFSKGMAMRLDIARALLAGPDLLVLDEPTGGLDPTHARDVLDLVEEERARGTTVLLSTHDMAVADERCDRVALIVDGRLAALDTPHALKVAGERDRMVRITVREHDGTRRVQELPLDGLADSAEFRALSRAEAIETLHSTESSLADVFVALTGRHLR